MANRPQSWVAASTKPKGSHGPGPAEMVAWSTPLAAWSSDRGDGGAGKLVRCAVLWCAGARALSRVPGVTSLRPGIASPAGRVCSSVASAALRLYGP